MLQIIEGSTPVSIENFIVHILAKGNYFNLIERWFCAELGNPQIKAEQNSIITYIDNKYFF